ncbi:phage antirepressor KilAC domain-containing protein [Riemerella anatipestifer]|uniref:phage antirepressor KilAC domain-containing protein n=1 Tax=Riemerella anatipestifer TaxID=34085 RepID=UPI001BDB65FB|nr:phage antirepressor KilAC domain-containing protein [Riemerella anatipestifer]MBT0558622.1 phage antirepressor KilAC domain-containing protein [Riemerella anatipestifer]
MKELIKITEQNGRQAVSARELHSFLESKQDFSNWIKNRIEKYGLIEGQDYQKLYFDYNGNLLNINLNKNIDIDNQRVMKIEYILSLDTSKELAMVEGNEKGKQARRYFIECEKKLRTGAYALPQTFAEALKLAAQQAERLELQQAELKKQAPKVAYYEEVLQSESTYNTNQIAKELGMSAITLNKKLQDLKVQYRQGGTWLLYHKYQNKGYTKTKTHTYTDTKGATQTSMQTVWTEKGRLFIHEALSKRLQTA